MSKVTLNSRELRVTSPMNGQEKEVRRNELYLILDNVLDTYNVGSIFRLADATAVKEVILCGETLTPPNIRITRASIETWRWVPWRYEATALDAINNLKRQIPGISIYGVEQDQRSVKYTSVHYKKPCALVVGNETYGIGKRTLDACDSIVELPMWGINKSLNVMVSCGIVMYQSLQDEGNIG